MPYPDWALKHKVKNSELRKSGDNYKLYSITSKWDPEKKRTKKVTLKQIGIVTEEYGLIPTGMKKKGRIKQGESPFKTQPEEVSKKADFIDELKEINDERSERNRLHSVSEILFAALASVLAGGDGWQDMEDFGEIKIDFLRQYYPYQYGAPSNDTFRRFFRACDPGTFEKLFRSWVAKIAKIDKPQVIAIDGKASRHTFSDEQKMMVLVNVLATESRIILGRERVSEKSNEINALPKILEWLDVKGHIVTIDAMGCQYEIANLILQKEGNYIFSLKGNQGNLCDDVTLYFQESHVKKEEPFIENDKGHGRIETRKCWVSHDVEWLKKMNPNWQSIESIVHIQSTRDIKNKVSIEDHYYISSLKETPQKMLESIRSHWAIENKLHWVLDMSFFDDQSRIREGNAPHIMAILRHVAFNLLQLVKTDKISIRRLRKMCALDKNLLEKVMSSESS
jgi:predicted transposase YbfD/YdcC